MHEPSPTIDAPHACDLCGRRNREQICEFDRHNNPLRTDVCRHCGLVSHATIPSKEELADYYARKYRISYHAEYRPSPYRVIRDWNRGEWFVRLLTPHISQEDRIIEIGCGIGTTVKQFQQAGFNAEGIEPGVGFCQFGLDRLKANIQLGSLDDLPETPSYDVALLVHVLEHLRSPTTSLAHIHQLLHPGGQLYVEVPNAGAPHSAPGRMFHFAHIYNLTAPTLQMLVEKSGFRVRQWLSKPGDKNLRVLVERSTSTQWQVDPNSYEYTLAALHRYNSVSYHLRSQYLKQRVVTLLSHPSDHFLASRRLNSILRKCA